MQFFIYIRHDASASLFGVLSAVAVQRQIARDRTQKSRQKMRALPGHGIPRAHPGVIHALLCILRIMYNVVRDAPAVTSVLLLCLCNRRLIPVPVQRYDFFILHAFSLSVKSSPPFR